MAEISPDKEGQNHQHNVELRQKEDKTQLKPRKDKDCASHCIGAMTSTHTT